MRSLPRGLSVADAVPRPSVIFSRRGRPPSSRHPGATTSRIGCLMPDAWRYWCS